MKPSTRSGFRRVVAAGGALLLLGLGTQAVLPAPAELPGGVVTRPIETSQAICPLPLAGRYSASVVAAGVVEGVPQGSGPGLAGVGPIGAGLAGQTRLTKAGEQVQVLATGTSLQAVDGAARGSLASGFHMGQLTRSVGGDARGLSSLTCRPASADQWFVGTSSAEGRRSEVVMVNPGSSPVQVDVAIYGSSGLLATPGTRGVLIAPGRRSSIRLDAVVPGQKVLAVHVMATVGRVAAVVTDQELVGLRPAGVDYVPASAAPARKQIIPGIPGGEGARTLAILVPGPDDAGVSVRALTREGSVIPVGLERLDAPAGRVVSVDLASALKGGAAAVELSADRPIIAGFRAVIVGPQSSTEAVFGAAASPARGPGSRAVATGLPVAAGLSLAVMVAAPEGQVSGTITLIPYGTSADSLYGSQGPIPPSSPSPTPTASVATPTGPVTLPPLPSLEPLPNGGPVPAVDDPSATPSGSPRASASGSPGVSAGVSAGPGSGQGATEVPTASPQPSGAVSGSGSAETGASLEPTLPPDQSTPTEGTPGQTPGSASAPASASGSASGGPLPTPLPSGPDITNQEGARVFPVTVPGGSSGFVALPAPPDAAWYTAVWTSDVGSGPAYLAHLVVETGADYVSATGFPWIPLRPTVLVSDARPDLTLTLP